MRETLGEFFRGLRGRANLFKWLMFAALAAVVALNFVIHPHHPHVEAEKLPGFWAAFGLGSALVMVWVMKKIVAHLLGVSEDFYDRD